MIDLSVTAPARLATRLAFLAAGFAMACWAPLIPYVKARVGADEAELGLLLLCLGIGSVTAMPVTGFLASRYGARSMVLLGGLGMVATLPLLAISGSSVVLGAVLLLFGAALGTLDVSMNVHAVEVETKESRPLMSGFHAMFSVGAFIGSGLTTFVLSVGFGPFSASVIGAALALFMIAFAGPRLLRARPEEAHGFSFPRGIVLLLAVLAGIAFLAESAVLDWGALLLIDRAMAAPQNAGLGYMLFSIAMVIARLTGDRIVSALGEFRVLVGGGIVTIMGIAVTLLAPWALLTMGGFVLIGLGAANVVPVIFSATGRQKVMPAGLAIASATTVGYAGILLGPALIGFAAHVTSLPTAFWIVAVLMMAVPLTAGIVARVK